MIQDWPNGELASRCRERANAEAILMAHTASYDRGEGISTGFSTAQALASTLIRTGLCPESINGPVYTDPRPRSIGGPASCHSTSDWSASPAPICFPLDNFKHSLTLFSKSFSSFPHGTCLLLISHPYLALERIYRRIRATLPNNLTRRQRLMVR
ncbi:Protein TAR1 [Camellia lanceoleosa]|uniref:Protein TAR1 n=1 Tax=Camellia lanceoleosa TaxID=1840588 RepID=A0ACC0IE60_9ERIC|nr:Protein TAR1 [Camellia lanceoleosa]